MKSRHDSETVHDLYGSEVVIPPAANRSFKCARCGCLMNYLSREPRCANEACAWTVVLDLPFTFPVRSAARKKHLMARMPDGSFPNLPGSGR